MPRINGIIEYEGKAFNGFLYTVNENGIHNTTKVDAGVPTFRGRPQELVLEAGSYTVQYITSPDSNGLTSSYPQYKWKLPAVENLQFKEIESKQLV